MPFAKRRAATAAKFSVVTATSAAAAAAVLVHARARHGIYTEVVLSECERV